MRKYYRDYHVQHGQRMQRHQDSDDAIIRQLVDDCIAQYLEEAECVPCICVAQSLTLLLQGGAAVP